MPYVRSYTGPMTLTNDAANKSNTRIAVELGSVLEGTTIEDEDPFTLTADATYPLFKSTTNEVTIPDLFEFNIDNLTVNGLYTFKVQIGTLEEEIKVNVINPVPVVDLKLTGAELAADGKYYVTLPIPTVANKVTTAADYKVTIGYELSLLNMKRDSSNNVSFRLETSWPNLLIQSDDVAATVKPGNSGHLEAAALIGKFPGTGSGASRVTEFTEAGTYVFDLTVNGVNKKVELVVLPSPTLTLNSAKVGTTTLGKHTDGNLIYEVPSGAAFKVVLNLAGKDLPSGTLYYKVTDGIGSTAFVRSDAALAAALNSDAISITTVKELKFTAGSIDIEIETASQTIATGASDVREIVVVIMKKGVTHYESIGFATFKLYRVNLVANAA